MDDNSPQELKTTYFFDRNISWRHAADIRQLGFLIECHRDHFIHDAHDNDIIKIVKEKSWVLVTFDGDIRQEHRPALREYSPKVLFLGRALSKLKMNIRHEWMIENWAAIDKKAKRMADGETMGVSHTLVFRKYS